MMDGSQALKEAVHQLYQNLHDEARKMNALSFLEKKKLISLVFRFFFFAFGIFLKAVARLSSLFGGSSREWRPCEFDP